MNPQTLYRVLAPAYDRISPLWRDWLYREPSRALDAALLAECPSGAQVLDLGCGTGAVLDRLIALGAPFGSYLGVDLSPAMLARARGKHQARTNVRFEPLDLACAPLPVGPFDLVTSAWALEHLDRPGDVVARSLERLRAGGRMVLFFEEDDASRRARLVRRVWKRFGVRLVPTDEWGRWPASVSGQRFRGIGPSVALVVLAFR